MRGIVYLIIGSVFFHAHAASFKVTKPPPPTQQVRKNTDSIVLDSAILTSDKDLTSEFREALAFDQNGKLRLRAFWRGDSQPEARNEHQTLEIFDVDGKRVEATEQIPEPAPIEIARADFDTLFQVLRILKPTQLIDSLGRESNPVISDCAFKLTYSQPLNAKDSTPVTIKTLDSLCGSTPLKGQSSFSVNVPAPPPTTVKKSQESVILMGVIEASGKDDSDYKELLGFDVFGRLRIRAFWRGNSQVGANDTHQVLELFDANGKRVEMNDQSFEPEPVAISKEDFDALFLNLSNLKTTHLTGLNEDQAEPVKSDCPFDLTFTQPISAKDQRPVKILSLVSQCK